MKHFLLLIILLLSPFSIAQNKVWDFGNDNTNFPGPASESDPNVELIPDPTVTTSVTIDGLTLESGGNDTFGQMRWKDVTTGSFSSDTSYSAIHEMNNGKSSGGTAFLPEKRVISFEVTGPVNVKIWFRDRNDDPGAGSIWVTDGTSEIFHYDSTGTDNYMTIEGNYTGGAGTLYIFSKDKTFKWYKIQTSTTLNTNKLKPFVSTCIKAIGSRIYVTNVEMESEINIYSISGALVHSFKTNYNTDFSFSSGIFIAQIKTEKGQKSVKLITN